MKNDRHAAKGNKLQAVWEGGGWGVLLRPSSGKVLCVSLGAPGEAAPSTSQQTPQCGASPHH